MYEISDLEFYGKIAANCETSMWVLVLNKNKRNFSYENVKCIFMLRSSANLPSSAMPTIVFCSSYISNLKYHTHMYVFIHAIYEKIFSTVFIMQ